MLLSSPKLPNDISCGRHKQIKQCEHCSCPKGCSHVCLCSTLSTIRPVSPTRHYQTSNGSRYCCMQMEQKLSLSVKHTLCITHGRQHFVACCACRMELKLSMDIKALRGPLYVWLPPPPGDRMWFSFLEAPQLQVTASPLVGLILNKVLRYISHGRATSHVTSH